MEISGQTLKLGENEMNIPVNVLLSEAFAEFSGKITALHEKKKELTVEIKKLVEEHKVAVAAIDAEAASLQNAFAKEKESPSEKKK